MRIVSKFVAAGLSCLPWGKLVATPAQDLSGVLRPYHKLGQDPNRPDDPPITDAQFREDLGKIVQKFGYIRTYGTEKRMLGLGPFVA